MSDETRGWDPTIKIATSVESEAFANTIKMASQEPHDANRRTQSRKVTGLVTTCTEGFFEVEKCVENGIKSTNSIAIFYALKSVSKVKIFLLCHLLFAKKFNFNYTF